MFRGLVLKAQRSLAPRPGICKDKWKPTDVLFVGNDWSKGLRFHVCNAHAKQLRRFSTYFLYSWIRFMDEATEICQPLLVCKYLMGLNIPIGGAPKYRMFDSLYGFGPPASIANSFSILADFFDASLGVLQGEMLSPLLFALYVSDIDKFLVNKGCQPVSLGGSNFVHILILPDDNVTLAETKQALQFKIDGSGEYFDINDLEVNLVKNKAIVFRRGGRLSKQDIFFYKGSRIEVVKNYTYLGIVFSSSGLFIDACSDRLSKSRVALRSR